MMNTDNFIGYLSAEPPVIQISYNSVYILKQ